MPTLTNGRGTFMIKRVFPGIARMRRASGTKDPAVLEEINHAIDALIERGDVTTLRRLASGETRALALLEHQSHFRQAYATRRTVRLCYIIQASPSGNLKIGCASNVNARVKELQCATWESLSVIATLPGAWATEQRLHKQFADHHIAREWFRPAPEILALACVRTPPGTRQGWTR